MASRHTHLQMGIAIRKTVDLSLCAGDLEESISFAISRARVAVQKPEIRDSRSRTKTDQSGTVRISLDSRAKDLVQGVLACWRYRLCVLAYITPMTSFV